jgi:hypothetical protein
MTLPRRVFVKAGFLPGFFMLIWRKNLAPFAAASVRAKTPEAV